VVQRVRKAGVLISEEETASIHQGLCVLLGVHREDSEKDAEYLAQKIAGLRIFADQSGKFNLSLKDVEGKALVVSQFTLLGNCTRGRRPDFLEAAPPERAEVLYIEFIRKLRDEGVEVLQGVFQEHMVVCLENDGPVTIILDSRPKKR